MPADGSPSPTSFGLTDAADILAPYIQKERDYDAAQMRCFERRAAEVRGLSSYIGEPPAVRTEAQLREAAQARKARRDAWKASPRGRLHAAIVELGEVGFHQDAATLRGIFDRSIGMSAEPSPEAIGAMLAVLEKINLSTAREAGLACAELLLAAKEAA